MYFFQSPLIDSGNYLSLQEFVAPHRHFVRESVLNAEVNASGKRQLVQFALFSDIIIKNENPKKKIKPEKLKYQWPLRLVWIQDLRTYFRQYL